MGNLTKNFSRVEFAQRNPFRPIPAQYQANVQRLANQLQALRDELGTAITINSSYRTLAKNTAIGGASTSQHLTAKAADFIVPGVSKATVYCTILALIKAGKMEEGGLGWYGAGGHIHYDVRGSKARWNKSGGALPVCRTITLPAEEDDMGTAYYTVEGRGSQVWGGTGGAFWRADSAEFALAKKRGLKTPLEKMSKKEFDATRKRLHMD